MGACIRLRLAIRNLAAVAACARSAALYAQSSFNVSQLFSNLDGSIQYVALTKTAGLGYPRATGRWAWSGACNDAKSNAGANMPAAKTLMLLCLLAGQADLASAQSAYVEEIYSNADGSAQFIVLTGNASTEGTTVLATHDSQQHIYTLPANLPAGRFLAATQGFARRYGIEADFVLPDSFLFTHGTQVRTGVFSTAIIDVPTDGTHSLYTDFDYDDGIYPTRAGSAVAVNHAGKVVALAPLDVTGQVEYYHSGLDRYFLTSYPDEMSALDTGAIAGWQRTGQTIPTWTGPAMDKGLIPGTGPVCRVYVDESHFYAIDSNQERDVPRECLGAAMLPGAIAETWNAFYAGQPDPLSGTCVAGESPVYRLWNPRGTGHRYTTQRAVRDEMVRAGYVAEGYGPDGVMMCVAGSDGPRKRSASFEEAR